MVACSTPASPPTAPPGSTTNDTSTRHPEPSPTQPEPDPKPPAVTVPQNVRAAWVHLFDDTLKTPAGITTTVNDAAAAGVNLLIVQIARRHDAYYRSNVLPRTTDDTLDDRFDVLADVLAKAHAHGIAVHAWYGIAPTWHAVYDTLPHPNGDWIATAHGISAPEADRWVTRRHNGTWTEYLDVGVPAVRQHVIRVVEELVAEYPIDGVHLDYVRYSGIDTGYNPHAIDAFQQAHETQAYPAPSDPTFVAWRQAQVTALMRDVHAVTHRHGVVLSAAVITWGVPPVDGNLMATRTGTEALQPWDTWLADGILDVAFPMNYFRAANSEHAAWFTGWLAYQQQLDRQVDGHVVAGVGGYLNSVDDAIAQLDAAVHATGSAAVYSWQQPTSGPIATFRAALADRWRDPDD